MKRNIIYVLLFSIALLLTACGSDSKIDPIASDANISLPTDPADPTLPTDPTLPIDTAGMVLNAAPDEINIATAGESQAISLYLSNDNGPVANTNIKGNWFDPNMGTLNSYSVATNENGQAVFNYTAPVSLPASDLIITFEVENGDPVVTENVIVKFGGSTVPQIDATGMVLTAAPDEINIATVGEIQAISLYLSNTNGSVANTNIKANWFDPNTGTLNSYSVITNTNGQAVFNYTAPVSLPVSDLIITFEVENGDHRVAEDVTVKFDKAVYIITPDQNITVTDLATGYTINAALMKQDINGIPQPAIGKKVIAEFLMPENGKLEQYEAVVDGSGIATFRYTSPNRTLPPSNTKITFFYENDHTVIGKTLLIFDSEVIDTVAHMYITPLSFTVTSPDEEQEITIVTVNSENIGISATVQLEQPHNGTDYGTFDTTNIVTNGSGYAVVKYTAPSNTAGLTERNITVTEMSQNISKELNIIFNPTSSSAKYEIVANVPGSFAVDAVDRFGIKIVEVGNPDNVIADADVHEVSLTSTFSNMLVFDNGINETTYDSLGDNTNIGIISKTLAGVALIEVSASIFDGTNNVVVTVSIPVTIFSGPVTALSIPYVGSGTCSSDQTGELPSNKHLVHAVDKYNNPAQVRITPTLINDAKIIVPNPNYGAGTGSIDNATNFNDATASFNQISTSDRLIITPNTYYHDYNYMGNWTIDEVVDSNHLLLSEQYTDTPVATGLSYIIGDEDRLLGRNMAVAHVVDPSGAYMTDANGTLLLEVCFDPILAGHTFTLGAYSQDNNRTGIATIEAFRWNEYTSEKVEVDNNTTTHKIYLGLGIGGAVSESLIDVDISSSSIIMEKKPHCSINYTLSNFHTDGNGDVLIVLNTDGNTSVTGGVDTCTVEWDAKAGSIMYEY